MSGRVGEEASYTEAEVAAHNRGDDCWVVVRGVVYDLTSFLAHHPGGPMLILPLAGEDATAPFEETGHSRRALQALESFRIGTLVGSPTQQQPAAPVAWNGLWQAMDCPLCGPNIPLRRAPAEVLAQAMRQGDAATRMSKWSQALTHYHEAIGALGKDTAAETVAAVRAGASLAQRKLGSLRSALRHADLAVASTNGSAHAHATRGAALESLGLVADAHRAYARAAALGAGDGPGGDGPGGDGSAGDGSAGDGSAGTGSVCGPDKRVGSLAGAAARLLPLRLLLAPERVGEVATEPSAEGQPTPPSAEQPTPPSAEQPTPPSAEQRHLVSELRIALDRHGLAPRLLPLPSAARVLDDDCFESSPWRCVQRRLLALLSVDAAVAAARAAGRGLNGSAGVREWLLRRAGEMGMDVTAELLGSALRAGEEEAGEGGGSASSASEDDDNDEDEGPMVSEELSVPGAYGRCLLQFELAPERQRLTLSLVSLNAADLGVASLTYTFAVGLASAYLLSAESLHEPFFEFAEWRENERGALCPAEGLPPAECVERRARAAVDFFCSAEGARPPVAPRDMPPMSAFAAP